MFAKHPMSEKFRNSRRGEPVFSPPVVPKIFMDLLNRVLSTQRNHTLNLYWASDLFAN
jgi:hypothetical protein